MAAALRPQHDHPAGTLRPGSDLKLGMQCSPQYLMLERLRVHLRSFAKQAEVSTAIASVPITAAAQHRHRTQNVLSASACLQFLRLYFQITCDTVRHLAFHVSMPHSARDNLACSPGSEAGCFTEGSGAEQRIRGIVKHPACHLCMNNSAGNGECFQGRMFLQEI